MNAAKDTDVQVRGVLLLALAVSVASAPWLPAAEQPTLTTADAHAIANWSSFAGNGTFTPPMEGLPLVSAPAQVRVAWRLPHPMGVQKTNAARDGEFYGGTACVIAGDGIVFTSYIRPSGDVLNEKRVNRYYPLEKQPTTVRQIDADDVTIAVDADTGRLLWQADEKGMSLNFLFGKRGHYGVTPAYGNGMVFTWGALGKIYAYDAKTGTKRWATNAAAFHAKASAVKAKALAEKNIPDTYGAAPLFEDLRTGLVVADGTLVAPDGFEGLIGFDAATGTKRWAVPDVIARGATPAIWRHEGAEYLLCPRGREQGGKISLLAPADGRVLWRHTHAGPAHTSLVVGGDRVLFNTRGNMSMGVKGPQGDKRAGMGLLACHELSLQGPRLCWTLEDAEENWHDIRPDRGMNRRIAIRDGIGYLLVGVTQKLVSVRMDTGKIIQRDTQTLQGTACSPVLAENLMFLPLDVAHSWGSVVVAVYALKDGGTFERLGEIPIAESLKVDIVTDYEVANEMAYWKGCFFTKTREGLAAIDVRSTTGQ